MKRMITVILSLLMLCNLLYPVAYADNMEYTSGDYSYVLNNDGTAQITGYYGDVQTLSVPDTLNGITVSSVGRRAFARCDFFNVILPETLVSIEEQAFAGCDSLVGIIIPLSVMHIGNDAFKACNENLLLYVAPDSAAEEYCWYNDQSYFYYDAKTAENMLQTTPHITALPVVTATVRPTATPVPTAEQQLAATLRNAKVGDIINFGQYKQDRFGTRKTPIQWIVLEKLDSSMLIITQSCLETMTYHKKNTSVTWETCSLREWLNNSFISQAFNKTEQNLIVTTQNNNDSCAPTSDRAFLLDIDEVSWYFANDNDRRSWPTAYALENGAYTSNSGTVWWWLRTTGKSKSYAAGVSGSGKLDPMGDPVNMKNGKPVNGVRPAVWLNLDP